MCDRREPIKAGVATVAGTALAGEAGAAPRPLRIHGGEDYSPKTGPPRRSVPTACGQCPAACPARGYVEQGRVVQIEGHPRPRRTLRRPVARGHWLRACVSAEHPVEQRGQQAVLEEAQRKHEQ